MPRIGTNCTALERNAEVTCFSKLPRSNDGNSDSHKRYRTYPLADGVGSDLVRQNLRTVKECNEMACGFGRAAEYVWKTSANRQDVDSSPAPSSLRFEGSIPACFRICGVIDFLFSRRIAEVAIDLHSRSRSLDCERGSDGHD